VKKILFIVAGLAVVAGTAYVAGRLGAQPGAPGSTPPATRIAFINVDKVFMEYKKANFFRDELKGKIEPKRVEYQTLAKSILSKKHDLETRPGLTPQEREAIQRDMIALQRKMEDLNGEMEKAIGARSDDITVQLYRDLQENVQKYAAANNFQAVLAYREPPTGDPLNMMVLVRRDNAMKMGTLSGMVVPPGLDISGAVVNLMNQNYAAAPGAPGAAPVTPTGFTPKQ
jgi:Skp family chaperone for outer membrane proteins